MANENNKAQGKDTIIEVSHLKQYFTINTGFFQTKPLKAVDDISFSIREGETLGLVGESGCGKTTAGRTILHLYKPTGGEVIYRGKAIRTNQDIADFRKKATMVFQDPYSSLDPRMTVADIIGEPLDVQNLYKTKAERRDKILELMDHVGLNSEHAARYAHEFSGGQRQRVGIARALAVDPDFIVCDEPVSALDVSIQAQVINLMLDLQEQWGFAYMFVTHDLSVVKYISDEIMVMYLGQVVEKAPANELFSNTLHPYSKALLSAIPIPKYPNNSKRILIQGEITSPINPKPGCRFMARCHYASEACSNPQKLEEHSPGHFVACCRYKELINN